MTDRQRIREALKLRRQQHSAQECALLSLQICEHLQQHAVFRRKQRLALYYPTGNEANLLPLLDTAWAFHKQTFLPVLSRFPAGHLWWLPYTRHTPLYPNRFGIPEPQHRFRDRLTRVRSLDIVFMPLVGFDASGNRLGMGGGYYDRSLAKCYRKEARWHRPLKIGVAYSWQQVEHIPAQQWDIPLDAIATEQGLTWF